MTGVEDEKPLAACPLSKAPKEPRKLLETRSVAQGSHVEPRASGRG